MEYGKFGNSIEGRLHAIRKDKKLNQEEFGKRIGVTRSAICNYEGGTRPIGEQVILAICREFSVNELWMRNGIGNPYNSPKNGVIDKLIGEYRCSKFEGDFLKMYFQMKEEERTSFVRCAYRLLSPLMKGMQGRNPFTFYFDATDEEDEKIDQINREVEEYRKRLVRKRYDIPFAARNEVDESESAAETLADLGTTDQEQTEADAIEPERTEVDIAAELAELKRQNQEKDKQLQELAAEIAAMKEEDALLGLTDAFSASPSASVGNISPAQKTKI